jgi:SAM-dependent methyltransferase
MVTALIRYVIDIAKRNKFIQNIFESPFDLSKYPQNGEFTDSKGNSFQLLDGLRSKIRPGWEGMLKDRKFEVSEQQVLKAIDNGRIAVEKVLPLIESAGKKIKSSKVLDVGCHAGGSSFALASKGTEMVTGTEFSGYKVASVDMNDQSLQSLESVNDELKRMREMLAAKTGMKGKVSFVDDDICHSRLEHDSFDIICSWEVLEHLHDTNKAFRQMHALLKKGGIMVHEYNPFFCLNGGHSLCTLDFLWGHVRLSEPDFERYLDEIRPNEKEKALSFYKKGLNRMTQHQLKIELEAAGFQDISILPFTKEQHLRMIDQDTLTQSRDNYPDLSLIDLCAPRVIVIANK